MSFLVDLISIVVVAGVVFIVYLFIKRRDYESSWAKEAFKINEQFRDKYVQLYLFRGNTSDKKDTGKFVFIEIDRAFLYLNGKYSNYYVLADCNSDIEWRIANDKLNYIRGFLPQKYFDFSYGDPHMSWAEYLQRIRDGE